jgi:hypothetical protein
MSTKAFIISRSGDRFWARVVQTTQTAAGAEEQLLDSRWFGTEAGARRWLARQS